MSHDGPIRIRFGLVNAYLIRGDQGDVLIDTGLPGGHPLLLHALHKNGSSPERLKLIILTHVHFDHVGNLHALRRLTKAPLLVHRLELPTLEAGRVVLPAGQTALARLLMGAGSVASRFVRFHPCRPDIVVDEDVSLTDFGLSMRVVHTPGHTHGSISILMDNGDAVIGDLCQNGWGFGMGIGRIVPPLADAPEALAPSWRKLIGAGVQRLFPGHGRLFESQMLHRKLSVLDGKHSP